MTAQKPAETGGDAVLPVLIADYRAARESLERLARHFLEREQAIRARPEPGRLATHAANGHQPGAPGPVLTVYCLGQFRMELNGAPVPLPATGQPLRALKFLACRGGRPTPRDLLMEVLWPDADAESAANRLRVSLHALRKTLEGNFGRIVVYENGCYSLDPRGAVAVDAYRFEELWKLGQEREQAGDTPGSLAYYRSAEGLYAGEFLAEDPYEEWTLLQREHLKDLHLNIVTRLAAAAEVERRFMACIDHSQELLRHDACNEEAYRMLIRANTALGRHGRAAAWYRTCEVTLREELGIPVSGETRALRPAQPATAG